MLVHGIDIRTECIVIVPVGVIVILFNAINSVITPLARIRHDVCPLPMPFVFAYFYLSRSVSRLIENGHANPMRNLKIRGNDGRGGSPLLNLLSKSSFEIQHMENLQRCDIIDTNN